MGPIRDMGESSKWNLPLSLDAHQCKNKACLQIDHSPTEPPPICGIRKCTDKSNSPHDPRHLTWGTPFALTLVTQWLKNIQLISSCCRECWVTLQSPTWRKYPQWTFKEPIQNPSVCFFVFCFFSWIAKSLICWNLLLCYSIWIHILQPHTDKYVMKQLWKSRCLR